MKRKVLGVLLSVVVIGAFYCLLIDSGLCFRFFHNAVTKEIRSRNSAWFKYSKIDSLYEQKHYKYFWFVRYGNESTIDIDTVFFKKNEVFIDFFISSREVAYLFVLLSKRKGDSFSASPLSFT